MAGPTLTELAANIGIELAKVPLDAGIDAAKKTIEILTGVNKQMDISGATQELQARLDTLAEAMKNQTTQLKTGKTAAEFTELLAAAIQAARPAAQTGLRFDRLSRLSAQGCESVEALRLQVVPWWDGIDSRTGIAP